jgi:EAL domain-containing protein (putative c-di-GMP-specific phosphodiesterase class I)
MHERAMERLRLEHELKRAIRDDELFLVYQAQVGLDGQGLGLEALVRWNHPTLGELAPVRFIPLAERSGLIVDVDAWVLRRACEEATRWSLPLRVSVNISARTLDSGRLAQFVGDALIDSGLPADRLEIEITERIAAVGATRAPETLTELRQWGLRVALDDFGTGYSALSQLSAYPLDTVKIDGSFIAQLSAGTSGKALVKAIIVMANALGLSVVAEGVETSAQLEFLRDSACDVAQGYFLARPVRADAVDVSIVDAVARSHRPSEGGLPAGSGKE